MKREYIRRGKRVEIEELENVAAVKPSEDQRSNTEQFGLQAALTPAIPLGQEQRNFEQGGWVFVAPTAEVREASEALSAPTGADSVQRVFVQPSGRMMLGLDRLSVQLRPEMTEEQAREALTAADLEVVHQLSFAPNLFQVRVSPGRDFLQVSQDLSANPDFVFAEPQFIENIPTRLAPTDPDYGQQWHLNNTGTNGGTAGADIRAEDAWDMTRGAGIRVAMVDNGFDLSHPDLGQAVDPDVSGHFQAAANPADPAIFVRGLIGMPNGNHGTFCAGMAVARANNGEGGCGVANEARFIAVASLNDTIGTQETLARAIAYIANPATEGISEAGADIISCSLGPNNAPWEMSSVLQLALDSAVATGRGGLGTSIFWATDNGNVPVAQDEVVSYEPTIGVGRSTRDDREDNSAFGPELDFLATGVQVFSTQSGGGYGTSTGTSFAAPTAAGVGALLLAVCPGLTWTTVRQIMRETCDKIGGVAYDANGHNNDYGYGRINAKKAIAKAISQC